MRGKLGGLGWVLVSQGPAGAATETPAGAAVAPEGLAGAAVPRLIPAVAGGTQVLTGRLEFSAPGAGL